MKKQDQLAEGIARAMHETQGLLAEQNGQGTTPEAGVPWERLPKDKRDLLIATAKVLLENGVIK